MTTKLEVSSRSFRGPPPEVTLKFCAGRTSRFRTQLRHPAEVPPRSLDDEDYFDPRLMALEDSLDGIETDLHDFMKWYAEAEAIENIERLGEAGVGWRDPILDGVRSAIISLDSRWTSLKYDRKKRTLIVAKSGTELSLSSLSDGEKSLIALAGEIGWRLAVGCGDPKTAEAVVLLDEVELHLHPSLQRVVLPRLQAAFPKVQFIATTHSPQVVASVPSDRVHVLRDFQVVAPSGGTYGRDSNSLLEDVFGTDSRPTETRDKLDAIARAIDAESFDEARKLVAELQSTLGAQDRELNRLESMVEYLDTGT